MFNSLKYTKKLEEAGFTRDQAEIQMAILSDVIENTFATKHDIAELRQATSSDIAELRQATSNEIALLKAELIHTSANIISTLRFEAREQELRMTIKLGSMFTVAVGVFAAIVKLT